MTFTLLEAHIASNNIKIMFNITFIEKFTFFFLILKEAELMYFKNNNTLSHRYKMKCNTSFYLLYFVLITLPKLWKGFVVYWNIFPNRLELELKTITHLLWWHLIILMRTSAKCKTSQYYVYLYLLKALVSIKT